MEIKIKHIEHAHSEYGHVGYIELTNNTKIWFGGKQPIKDEEEARKVADLYVAAPLMLEAIRDFTNKVDTGRARSVDSYSKFKVAIEGL